MKETIPSYEEYKLIKLGIKNKDLKEKELLKLCLDILEAKKQK